MKIVLVLFSPMPVEREGSKDTTGIGICLENKKTSEEHISNGPAQSGKVREEVLHGFALNVHPYIRYLSIHKCEMYHI